MTSDKSVSGSSPKDKERPLLSTAEELAEVRPDILIIGSGPAGTAVAEYLYTEGSKLTVGVLERGPVITTTHIGNFTEVRDPTRPQVPGDFGFRRGRFISAHERFIWDGDFEKGMMIHALGGRGIVAGAHLARFYPEDFLWPENHWPLGGRDLERFYTRAEQVRHVACGECQGHLQVWAMGRLHHYNAYPPPWGIDVGSGRGFSAGRGYDSSVAHLWTLLHDDYVQSHRPPHDGGDMPRQRRRSGRQSARVRRGAPHDGGDMPRRRRRLFVAPDTYVARIDLRGDKAHQLICYDTRNNQSVPLPVGKAVILAASPIESARLALNSGLGNQNENVGRYLADHIYIQAGIRLTNHGLSHLQGQCVNVVIPPVDARPEHRFQVEIRGEPRENTGSLYLQLTAEGATDPQWGNRVALSEPNPEKDDYKVPRANTHFTYSAGDKARIEMMKYRLQQLATALGWEHGLQDVKYMHGPGTPEEGTLRQLPPGRSHHEAGTLRMGKARADSVTNPYGLFHGLANVYAADASVFPCVGVANPMLTITALGYRLGEHLLHPRSPASASPRRA
jgi:choline dehydrogenase-like flavoprotein